MKQTIKLLALLLMPLFIISSCIEDKMIQGVTASSDAKSLYLSANYITTSYESSKTSVTVKASNGVGWEIIDIPSWVTVSPSRGTGPGSVTIYFSENTSTSRRRKVMQVITTDNDWMANVRLEVVQDGKPNEPDNPVNPDTYEGVDLGLSVLWASFNVGAPSPEAYGNYFAWGETYDKNTYDWSTYSWCNGAENTLTKYCLYPDYGNNGFTDGKYILEEQDDVAHVLWGDKWRTPSREEFDELLSYCNWEDETLNGVNGYRVTSLVEGYEGRSIFLPCAGSIVGDELEYGEYGVYWINSISTGTNTYGSLFYGAARSANYMYPRYAGMSVRPVAQSDTWPGITSISISKSATSVTVNGTVALTAFLWSGSRDYSFMFDAEWESADNNIATVNQQGVVTGVSPGGVVIRASYNGMVAVCVVDVYEYTPVTDYVDLGLSVNWATCNLGAMSPEQYGNYYAWGETTVKDVYNWTKYALSNGSGATLTRYCNDSEHGLDGYTDEEIYLLPEDDAAYVMLNGYGNFRMPTKDEFEELIDNCTWSLTEVNGVKGYLVTSRVSGYEGNSIFLPLSGYRSGSTMYTDELNYWSSQLFQNNCIGAWCLGERSGVVTMSGYTRALGGSIRPVIPSTTWTPTPVQYSSEYVDMGLPSGVVWASCNLGATTPDAYGNYYAWGETEPKKEYYWRKYAWGASTNGLTKYNTNSEYGIVDNLTLLEMADDAANVALGNGWRIPSSDDFAELLTYCSWTWTQMNGHNGYQVVGPNSNSIFLPAAGSFGANYLGEKSQAGYYWSNALNLSGTDCAWSLAFSESERGKDYVTGRAVCASIRPVYDGPHESQFYDYNTYKSEVIKSSFVNIKSKEYINEETQTDFARITEDPENFSNKCILFRTTPNPDAAYDSEMFIIFDQPLNEGDEVTVTMKVKAENEQTAGVQLLKDIGNWSRTFYSFTPTFTTSWKEYNLSFTAAEGEKVIALSLATLSESNTLYFDDITAQVNNCIMSHEYVDLGLSVMWATCNVGASAPEQYGDYYAWGELEPYYFEGYAQSTSPLWKWDKTNGYVLDNYKYYNSGYTKYCYDPNVSYNRIVDNKTKLEPEDDVAYVNWGEKWRIPTRSEAQELLNYCTLTWTTRNNVYGLLLTSNVPGYSDRSIFLPSAGYRRDESLNGLGNDFLYSTSSIKILNYNESCYYFTPYSLGWTARSDGLVVRPVAKSNTWPGITSIDISEPSITVMETGAYDLSVVLKSNDNDYSFMTDEVEWLSSDESVATVDRNGRVIGKTVGSSTITARYNGLSAYCYVNVTEYSFEPTGYEASRPYVDLGLSVKWATYNIGAESMDDYGDYYAWGETETLYEPGYAQSVSPLWKSGKSDGYSWSIYKYCNGSETTLTKYCANSDYGYLGYTDNLTTLDPADDVAHVIWGGNWRMPTASEMNELLNNCSWVKTTMGDVAGYKVTSKKEGYKDRFIFLPAAGEYSDTNHWNLNTYAGYLSSSFERYNPSCATGISCYMDMNDTYYLSIMIRCHGHSVRAVCP